MQRRCLAVFLCNYGVNKVATDIRRLVNDSRFPQKISLLARLLAQQAFPNGPLSPSQRLGQPAEKSQEHDHKKRKDQAHRR
jgi:hypothetical protein